MVVVVYFSKARVAKNKLAVNPLKQLFLFLRANAVSNKKNSFFVFPLAANIWFVTGVFRGRRASRTMQRHKALSCNTHFYNHRHHIRQVIPLASRIVLALTKLCVSRRLTFYWAFIFHVSCRRIGRTGAGNTRFCFEMAKIMWARIDGTWPGLLEWKHAELKWPVLWLIV